MATVTVHHSKTFITHKISKALTFHQPNLDNFKNWATYSFRSIPNCITEMRVLGHFMCLRMIQMLTSSHADILQRKVINILKIDVDSSEGFEGEWNSFNIVDVEVKGDHATYNLETTVMV